MKFKKICTGVLVFGILSTIVLFILWVNHSSKHSLLFDWEYDQVNYVSQDSIASYEDDHTCFYPDCSKNAEEKCKTQSLYLHIYDESLVLLEKLPNKANFKKCSDSFTYTEKEDHVVYDEGTYLVPQSDGSFKVDKRKDKYVVQVDGATNTMEYIYYEGMYCNEHAEIARNIWTEEVESVFITNNPDFYIRKYGLVLVFLITPILMLPLLVCFGIYKLFARKKSSKEE